MRVIMKKILLSTAFAAVLLTPVAAESFSGMFAGAKGAVLIFNRCNLPDLTKETLDVAGKDYGGFAFNGFNAGAELGYSFRFANNFALGLSLGGGYKHHTIKEARDTEEGEGKKVLGLDVMTSGFAAEARVRLGFVFSRFHIYLNPGLEVGMSNPEFTVSYQENGEGDTKVNKTHKITYANDKGPDWKDRLSFVIGLNAEYAITQTVYLGAGIGGRYGFGDVKTVKDSFDDATKAVSSVITDAAYKNALGIDVNVSIGASF